MSKMTQEAKDRLRLNEKYSENKKIKTRFVKVCQWNAGFSSYVCFYLAIMQQKYTKPVIQKWFNKLVDKDDYAQNEKRGVINYLYECNAEEFKKE